MPDAFERYFDCGKAHPCELAQDQQVPHIPRHIPDRIARPQGHQQFEPKHLFWRQRFVHEGTPSQEGCAIHTSLAITLSRCRVRLDDGKLNRFSSIHSARADDD